MIGYGRGYGLLLWCTLLVNLAIVISMSVLVGLRIGLDGFEQNPNLHWCYLLLGFASLVPVAVYTHKAFKFREEARIARMRDWCMSISWLLITILNFAVAIMWQL